MMKNKKKKHEYYDIRNDMKMFPKAWCFMVMSRRGPGKTYSTLRWCIEDDIRFAFIKRTKDDVDLLVKGDDPRNTELTEENKIDVSPFKPLNRDFGWNIHPRKIESGLAGFYDYEEFDGDIKPTKLRGYCVAGNMAMKVKGMDLSDVDAMIFDEFIARAYEYSSKNEGDAILDLYMTLMRDRDVRGRDDLKLIMLANAVEVNNPMAQIMEVVDIIAEMDLTGQEYYYNEYRGLVIHLLPEAEEDEEKVKPGIQRLMEKTRWGASSFGGHFSYNDFTALGKEKLKGHKCILKIKLREREFYLYKNLNKYFLSEIKGQCSIEYNLNRENQQKLFWQDWGVDLRQAAIEDMVKFGCYTAYDLIINYKKNFKV